MIGTDAVFAAEIQERMAGLAVCAGCEEEWVPVTGANVAEPVYCTWCAAMKHVMEVEFQRARKGAPRPQLPRQNVGVVPVEQAALPVPLPKFGGREVLMACMLYLAPGILAACLVAWIVLRLVCAGGIALAEAVSR